jgi:hypothetical protein
MGKSFALDDRGDIDVDIDVLIDTRLLIQSNSGGGKSQTVRRILEKTHGHVQQLVLDPEGEFSSLRKRFDYVHAAAVGGDCLAHPRSAALLAQRLLKIGASAILDLYELPKHDRIRFVRLFLEALINAPKSLWHPVLVVVDEAHLFCPQTGSSESAVAVIDLASRGRKRGFAAVLATQRIQKLHKDATAECNNKLIGRTAQDVDLARASDELGFTKTMWRDLKDLPAGHFFASGPMFTNQRGVFRVHVGGVTTPHPKAGSRIAYTAPPPTSAIRALLPQLADLPAEVEKHEKSIADLQGEIVMLRRELAKKPVAPPPQKSEVINWVDVPMLDAKVRSELAKTLTTLDKAGGNIDHLMKVISNAVAHADQLEHIMRARPLAPPKSEPKPSEQLREADAVIRTLSGAPSQSFPKAERAILTVLAQSPNGSSKSRLALLAGYASNGGGFNNSLGALKGKGFIRSERDIFAITEEGSNALGPCAVLPSGEKLRAYWLDKAGGKAERAVLTALFNTYPASMSKELIADAAGYAPDGGGFNNALGRLRTMELIEGRGELCAIAALFSAEEREQRTGLYGGRY